MNLPTRLRVEHLDDALGIDVRRPRLSWWLPAGAREQVAYRIRSDEWDSGKVESPGSVLVPYAGPELTSGQQVTWQVKVWTDAGETAWSAPAIWEMGLLAPEDWTARWIEPPEPDDVRSQVLHPAYLLRTRFTLDIPVERARLYATAHGVYEIFVNDHRAGDMELAPGFTSYWSRLQVQTFDVTGLLRPGSNTLSAVLSDGWFRGQTTGLRHIRSYGDAVALLAQLNVCGPDGTMRRIGTGSGWRSRRDGILSADLMEGQVVDHRHNSAAWRDAAAGPDGWNEVDVKDHDLGRLCHSPSPPVRRVAELRPVAITRPQPDRQVVDLGQNINGWVRLSNLGPAGTTLRLTHGEALGPDGDVTQENIALDEDDLPDPAIRPWDTSTMLRPIQIDQVTSGGTPGTPFEPRHTTHGFRYVRIEGHPGALEPGDVTGVVVHTDVRRTGWFACSDDRINQLHEAAVWSLRGNICDIPTDCPTRERAGWTGDWQIFAPAAAFLFDVAGFSTKWLRDLAADQRADGLVQHLAPNPWPVDGPGRPLAAGAAGWGDAVVIVPWQLYRASGDARVLEEMWKPMVAWTERALRVARDRRHPSRVAARARPAPHERFLWDTGFHWGEWLEPGEQVYDVVTLESLDHGELATAYLHHSLQLLARIATVLGRDEDATRYAELAAAVKSAWQEEFIAPDGSLARDTQAAQVRALAFGLVPAELKGRVAGRLADLIRAAGVHLGTGFLSTPYLLPVLADHGHPELAYDLLLQNTEPSWLTMMDRGATTIWEDWRGIDESGVPRLSLNHYSKGAVISFLHQYVAGLRIEAPGYERFRVAPVPGGGIGHARIVHESAYGLIEAAWHLERGEFTLEIGVPPNTSAAVRLPDGHEHVVGPGRRRLSCPFDDAGRAAIPTTAQSRGSSAS